MLSPGGGGSQARADLLPPPPGEGRGGGAGSQSTQPEPPLPTLEDAQALTPASDFQPFMRAGVAPEVKNAALKKLFADPHFNVMDRLDTYIDDYSKPDPIPPEMLKQLASAKFLKLFDDEAREDAAPAQSGREGADAAAGETVAQSATDGEPAVTAPPEEHADPDLRLQPNDAPGPEGPGEGPR